MKRIHFRAATLLAVAFASAAPADEPEIPAFKAYDLLTYTLVTHDEYTASQVPGQTARIDAFLTQQLATPVLHFEERVVVDRALGRT